LDLTLVNNNLFHFDARSVSTTFQNAAGSPNAQAMTLFQLPFSISEQARAFLTAETIKLPGALNSSITVTSEPPGLTLGFNEGSNGVPLSNNHILAPGDYLIAGNYTTLSQLDGVNIADAEGTLVITAPADLDGDLSVGASDLAIWKAGIGTLSPAGIMNGDIDGNLIVSGSDFLQWQREYGPVTISTVAVSSVPEPAGMLLAVVALLSQTLFRCRQQLGNKDSR
jgi:hypothetical protein